MTDYLEWLDSYSVGVEQIDADHKVLVSLANRAVHVVSDHHGSEDVLAILDELMNYTVYHFSHEEALMQSTGYPEFEQHRAIHERLVRSLAAFAQEYRRKALDAVAMANFMIEWLLQHILQEDARFAAHFHQHGVH